MKFEWDEHKRASNIDKHGIDFLDADLLFGGLFLDVEAKIVKGERRWLALGKIESLFVTAVFTRRDDGVRIISMRSATSGERARYQKVFDKGA